MGGGFLDKTSKAQAKIRGWGGGMGLYPTVKRGNGIISNTAEERLNRMMRDPTG